MNLRNLSLSNQLFIGLFAVPVFLVILYGYLIAADRYESTASLYITEERAQSAVFDIALLGITNAGSARDILVLKAFIESQAMFDRLDGELKIREHFSKPAVDFVSRLADNASKEDALEYYLSRVVTTFDEDAQLLEISVQSFDADYSKRLLDLILKHSQDFIDRLNDNISNAQLTFFEEAVKKSEEALLKENQSLRTLQNEYGILSTEVATQTITGAISALEQRLAEKQSKMNSLLAGGLTQDAPTLKPLQSEINSIYAQIRRENARLASDASDSLSAFDARFRDIKLRIEYKTLALKSNLDAFEKAQIEAARRLRFLTIVSPPTVAEESLYPNRPYVVLTAALIALMVYFIVSITVAMVREHA